MSTKKSKILIIEDDLDVADMLNAYFRVQGYDVIAKNWGEDGVRAVISIRPDLVILDIRLPDIDGYEVARRLRSDRKTKTIPIIFLTEKRDRSDRLQGLEIGADDYITKPFDVQELRLRVRNAIRRAGQDTLTNPVTGLPDGDIVMEYIGDCLKKDHWALLLVSLQNIDVFREKYGFVASDDVVRAISLMVNNSLRESGSRESFIGHVSLTEILLSVDSGNVDSLKESIIFRLNQALDYFYPITDRNQPDKSNRLAIQTSDLGSDDGRYFTAEELKTELLHRKK